jgi:hypothetical protein
MPKTVMGLFATPSSAQSVVDGLVDHLIRRDDIRLIPERATERTIRGLQAASEEAQAFEETAATSSVAVDLIEMGMPEKRAVYYCEAVRRGGTLVCVTVDDEQVATAERIIDSHGSLDIKNQAAQ